MRCAGRRRPPDTGHRGARDFDRAQPRVDFTAAHGRPRDRRLNRSGASARATGTLRNTPNANATPSSVQMAAAGMDAGGAAPRRHRAHRHHNQPSSGTAAMVRALRDTASAN